MVVYRSSDEASMTAMTAQIRSSTPAVDSLLKNLLKVWRISLLRCSDSCFSIVKFFIFRKDTAKICTNNQKNIILPANSGLSGQ